MPEDGNGKEAAETLKKVNPEIAIFSLFSESAPDWSGAHGDKADAEKAL